MSVSTAGFRRAGAGWGFLVVLVGLLGGNQARGAGFLIYDLSGEALGKASAVSASTSEPAAVWFNPAALAFAPSGVSLGSVLVVADSEFEPEGGGPRTDTEGGVFVLPTVFANARVHQRVALALGVFPAFGLSIKWPEAWIGRESAIKASITTVNVNPTVAVQLLPRLSLGAGFQAVRAAVEFINGLPAPVGGTARLGGGTWGYGGNVALLFRALPETLHLALGYRSRVKLDFQGRVDFAPHPDFEPSLPDQGGSASITLPDVFTLGVMWRPVPRLTLTFDPNLVLWNTYDQLVIDFEQAPDLVMERDNHPAVTLRFGAEWTFPQSGWALRGGFIFDQNPSPEETLAPSLPDANRVDFALGVGYTRRWFTADLGYLLVYFLPSDARGGTEGPPGTYRSVAHLLGLTLTARFR